MLKKIQRSFLPSYGVCKRLADALYQVVGQADQEKAQC